jgi:hypothetical protein
MEGSLFAEITNGVKSIEWPFSASTHHGRHIVRQRRHHFLQAHRRLEGNHHAAAQIAKPKRAGTSATYSGNLKG